MPDGNATESGCCDSAADSTPVTSCCCNSGKSHTHDSIPNQAGWIINSLPTAVATVPIVSTTMHWSDRLGAWKARWGINRMQFSVPPGLYAVGTATDESPVFVSANYKMSFDQLRSTLSGIDGWILVLDTKGVNVWCAAGKGTFGTDELVHRIEATRLLETISHKTVIVPQLGAPGIAAHEVARRAGVRVVYGPVLAMDIPAFLQSGMKATPEMRRVGFSLRQRLAVVPVELVMGAKYLAWLAAAFLLLAGFGPDGYSVQRVTDTGVTSVLLLLIAFIAGAAVTPALLPYLPGRALSFKGAVAGMGMACGILAAASSRLDWTTAWPAILAWVLLMPALASFAAMNFTGATTYTSLSGVRREMRLAVPIQAIAAVVGIGCWIVDRFV